MEELEAVQSLHKWTSYKFRASGFDQAVSAAAGQCVQWNLERSISFFQKRSKKMDTALWQRQTLYGGFERRARGVGWVLVSLVSVWASKDLLSSCPHSEQTRRAVLGYSATSAGALQAIANVSRSPQVTGVKNWRHVPYNNNNNNKESEP